MELGSIILPLHLLILLFALWNIYKADHLGLAWMLGKKEILNERTVMRYHHRIWLALFGMIATGFVLFYPMREFLLTRPQFFAKMGFIAALLLNSIAITFLQKRATKNAFAQLSFSQKVPLFVSGAISVTGWVGAIIMAFFLVPEY